VFCGEDPCYKVRLYLILVAGFNRHDIGRDFISVELSPGIDELFYGRNEIFRCENGPRSLATEFSVGEVICDTSSVIHVAMREEDVIYLNDLAGSLSYVEADIELRHSDDGFFPGDGVANYIEIIDFKSC